MHASHPQGQHIHIKTYTCMHVHDIYIHACIHVHYNVETPMHAAVPHEASVRPRALLQGRGRPRACQVHVRPCAWRSTSPQHASRMHACACMPRYAFFRRTRMHACPCCAFFRRKSMHACRAAPSSGADGSLTHGVLYTICVHVHACMHKCPYTCTFNACIHAWMCIYTCIQHIHTCIHA